MGHGLKISKRRNKTKDKRHKIILVPDKKRAMFCPANSSKTIHDGSDSFESFTTKATTTQLKTHKKRLTINDPKGPAKPFIKKPMGKKQKDANVPGA